MDTGWQNNTAGCKPDPEDRNGNCGYSNKTSSLAGGHIGPQQSCCPGDERNMTVSMNQMSDCHWMHRSMIDFMGYTMRTEEFRYTEWVSQSPPAVTTYSTLTDGGLAPEPIYYSYRTMVVWSKSLWAGLGWAGLSACVLCVYSR